MDDKVNNERLLLIRIGVIYKNNYDCAIGNTEIVMLRIIAFSQVSGHSVPF